MKKARNWLNKFQSIVVKSKSPAEQSAGLFLSVRCCAGHRPRRRTQTQKEDKSHVLVLLFSYITKKTSVCLFANALDGKINSFTRAYKYRRTLIKAFRVQVKNALLSIRGGSAGLFNQKSHGI